MSASPPPTAPAPRAPGPDTPATPAPTPPAPTVPGARLALAAFALLALARLALAANVGLIEDEAYYWTWSRRLAAGYFDHPPGIAWFIAAGTALVGKSELGVRLVPVLAGVAGAALLLPYSRDRLRYAMLVAGIPLYALGGVLATPDAPLFFGWCLALRGALDRKWVLTGLGVGLAGLGKYTGWGLWPLLLAAAPAEAAAMLPGVLVTLAVLAPNLWWNATHAWQSVGFQVGHGLNRPPAGALAFFGAQVGLSGPLFFLAGSVWAWHGGKAILRAPLRPTDDEARTERLLWFTSVPVVVFFTLAATRGSGEANWAAPAYLAVGVALARSTGRLERGTWIAAGVGLGLSLLVSAHVVRPMVEIKGDPTARLGVGADLARSVQAWGVQPVYTSRYQEAALLAWYGDLEAYALPGVDRPDQYDLWPIRWSDKALFVREWRGGPSATVDAFCSERGGANVVSENEIDGSPIQRWQIYEVSGCRAADPR